MSSNSVVAGRVLLGAAVLSGVWVGVGFRMHSDRMGHANAYERSLATRLGIRDTSSLSAFKEENLSKEYDEELKRRMEQGTKFCK